MNELMQELKLKLFEILNITDLNPEDLDNDVRLVGGNLDIDSIDILELVMMIEQDYGVKIDNKEVGEQVFTSIRSLAEYIAKNR
jgi:acyl carrier protein